MKKEKSFSITDEPTIALQVYKLKFSRIYMYGPRLTFTKLKNAHWEQKTFKYESISQAMNVL